MLRSPHLAVHWAILPVVLVVVPPASVLGDRLSAPPLEQVHGVTGVGSRRQLPNTQFTYKPNPVAGRTFSNSFNTKSNTAFAAHNTDNPGQLLQTTSLYNNPWYWNNVGSLETEMMTSGSGVPLLDRGGTGGYYNPFFYDQWKSSEGTRHSGSLSAGLAMPAWGAQEQDTRIARDDRRPAQAGDSTRIDEQQQGPGALLVDRTAVSAHRISAGLNAGIDDWMDGRVDRVLGRGVQGEEPVRFSGSALRGLGTMSANQSSHDGGLSMYDIARTRDDIRTGKVRGGLGQPWQTRFSAERLTTEPLTNRMSEQPYPLPPSPRLDAVHDAMAERASSLYPASLPLEDRLAALTRDYRFLRGDLVTNHLGGTAMRSLQAQQEEEARIALEDLEPAAIVNLPGASETAPGEEEPEPDVARPLDRLPEPMKWEDFDLLLRHGQRIDSFANNTHTRFDDLLAGGEDKLLEGDYFLAERRFNRALRFTPGHPLAMAGLGHAQLGAGLYLSSALTLQSLLGFQPEMIDVTYGPDVLPSAEDLDRAVSRLTDRLRGDLDLDRYGFLMAYIGHQLDRPDLIENGLNAMRRAYADEAYVELLEDVWLGDEEPEGTTP